MIQARIGSSFGILLLLGGVFGYVYNPSKDIQAISSVSIVLGLILLALGLGLAYAEGLRESLKQK